MKLESLVGYACNVIERSLDGMAQQQPIDVNPHTNDSYSNTFPLSDLTPTAVSAITYSELIEVINQAMATQGYKFTDQLQDPLALIGPDDAGVFIDTNRGNIGYAEVSVVTADPRALSKRWAEITSQAKSIAKQRDLGRGDKPLN
jgi:hypothetical protein